MKPTSSRFFQKAARALASADLLARDGDHETAVARAYYAMFYAAPVLLHEKGIRFDGAVHGAFGEYFVKPGLLDMCTGTAFVLPISQDGTRAGMPTPKVGHLITKGYP